METTTIDLTPALARELLGTNTMNRNIRKQLVEKYARDMAEGRWRPNPHGLCVSDNGTLMDGQHRCLAVIESGVTIPTTLVTGVPEQARLVVDTGAAKTAGDIVGMQGVSNAAQVATAARYILMYENYPSMAWTSSMVTKSEMIQFSLDHAEKIHEALHWGRTMAIGCRSIPLNPLTVAAYMILARTKVADQVPDFVEGIHTGLNLNKGDPRHSLRESVYALNGMWRTQSGIAVTIKAWNAYVQDRPLRSLRFRRNEMPMPEVL